MRNVKANSALDYQLRSSFEAVRKTLLEERFADRLNKPLAFWALPNDRRLPSAFLGRSVGELLATPFVDLAATPGVGHKKTSALIKLLHRATQDDPPTEPFGHEVESKRSRRNGAGGGVSGGRNGARRFDPAIVSEALWAKWREIVRRHNLGDEPLGRLAPSLRGAPTVIWHTPLSHYLGYSLAEIRRLKTYGEKRVRVVLEVFHSVVQILEGAETQGHLSVQMTPRFIGPVEIWLEHVLRAAEAPTCDELSQHFIAPLLEQVRVDAGDSIAKLAESRLGIGSPPVAVRTLSQRLGVTRARVYQLLDTCQKVIEVRWPAGAGHAARLKKLTSTAPESSAAKLIDRARELFFLKSRREA